ncbi:hypothetical protein TeGR_g1336, partial [Tetraparma gracilis]
TPVVPETGNNRGASKLDVVDTTADVELGFLGIAKSEGLFTAVTLLSFVALSPWIGYNYEMESLMNRIGGDPALTPEWMVSSFYLIGLLALFFFLHDVVFWRYVALDLEGVLKGDYDPLEKLAKIPRLKSLVEWHGRNLAVSKDGKFCGLVVTAQALFGVLVQVEN